MPGKKLADKSIFEILSEGTDDYDEVIAGWDAATEQPPEPPPVLITEQKADPLDEYEQLWQGWESATKSKIEPPPPYVALPEQPIQKPEPPPQGPGHFSGYPDVVVKGSTGSIADGW